MKINENFISNCVSVGFIQEFLESIQTVVLLRVGNRESSNFDFILITCGATLFEAKEKANSLHLKSSVSDDCIQFDYLNHLWSFAIYTKYELTEKLLKIFSLRLYGEIRGWVKGYWLPEGFLIDIMNADFCYGDFRAYAHLKDDLSEKWEMYRLELIERIQEEILMKNQLRQKYPKGSFWFDRLTSDLVLANSRLENLTSGHNATGFHHMKIKR